ncbi:MAG: hypothetical protein Q8930_10460, partial [Bacillota bacterium]|nr:hypothetical protein [Bacillota bacterium]
MLKKVVGLFHTAGREFRSREEYLLFENFRFSTNIKRTNTIFLVMFIITIIQMVIEIVSAGETGIKK